MWWRKKWLPTFCCGFSYNICHSTHDADAEGRYDESRAVISWKDEHSLVVFCLYFYASQVLRHNVTSYFASTRHERNFLLHLDEQSHKGSYFAEEPWVLTSSRIRDYSPFLVAEFSSKMYLIFQPGNSRRICI